MQYLLCLLLTFLSFGMISGQVAPRKVAEQTAPKVEGQIAPKVDGQTVSKVDGQKSFGFGYKIQDKKAIVFSTIFNGPAAKAGLKKADIILKLNSVDLTRLDSIMVRKTFAEAGDRSSFTINRNGATIQLVMARVERGTFTNMCASGNCTNGKGVFVDKAGSDYSGQFSNGKKEGTGKMSYTDGNVYEGEWVADRREGKGKIMYDNGNSYDGSWYLNEFHGDGTYTFKNGDTYKGKHKEGNFDGTITHYIKSSNETFIEVYKAGVLVSSKKVEKGVPGTANPKAVYGTLNYNNGDKYEGYIVNNSREGYGKYTYKTGGYSEGNWANDKMNGFGKYVTGRGSVYEGNWKDDVKDGEGKETDEDGTVKQQNWVNGQLHGKMITTRYENGKLLYTLEENLVEGKLVGDAKAVFANGDIYMGNWSWGAANGAGKYTYKNGDVAKGNFAGGKKHGLIDYVKKNGDSAMLYYNKDVMIGVYIKGKLNYDNGDTYEGKFRNGLEDGPGKLITRLETITGNWNEGFLNGRAVGILKEDGSQIIYDYRQGDIKSESFNPKKFSAQLSKFTEGPKDKFQYLLVSRENNVYKVSQKLNGFPNCSVKYYDENISSTGVEKWVFVAETENMTKPEALAMCTKLEGLFDKAKFSAPFKKDVEYNVATRRLISYDFDGRLPTVTLDAYGSDAIWTVTISITK